MGNVIDYLREYGDKSFSEYHFCEADVLLLAQLSYLKFDGAIPAIGERKPAVTLRQINETMDPEKVFEDKWYEKPNRELWSTILGCRRYETMKCNYYRSRTEEEKETQFGAVTFFPEGCEPVVAFRGTDGSIVGWKEDFNMAVMDVVPAQEMSVVYLNQVGCNIPGSFIVCGHSKGGNLAVYSSVWVDENVQRKITDVYSLDGPGFLPEVLNGDSYESIRSRVHRILPYSSLVGMLLQKPEEYEVIKSSGFGLSQHDCYTWQIENGQLKKLPDIQESQKHRNEALNRWIFSLTQEERERFVNTLFDMVEETKAATLADFVDDWKNNLKICLTFMRGLDPATRKYMRQAVKAMMDIYGSVMKNVVKQELKPQDKGKADVGA